MSKNRTENPNIASGRIDMLEKDEIFVFGSNLAGKHLGGAAKAAYNKFGAQWGVGKTFCSIYAAVQNGGPILIVLGLLITQWYKALKQFTNITKGDIVVVQGFDTLKNLWDMLEAGYKPKVVIFSTRTLFMYAVSRPSPYDSLPSYKKLQETIGFATKIFDECHLNFYANTQIDLQSSMPHAPQTN